MKNHKSATKAYRTAMAAAQRLLKALGPNGKAKLLDKIGRAGYEDNVRQAANEMSDRDLERTFAFATCTLMTSMGQDVGLFPLNDDNDTSN